MGFSFVPEYMILLVIDMRIDYNLQCRIHWTRNIQYFVNFNLGLSIDSINMIYIFVCYGTFLYKKRKKNKKKGVSRLQDGTHPELSHTIKFK